MTLVNNFTITDLRASAFGYARRGWPVFPIHHPIDGECSCGKPNCTSQAKHPLTPGAQKCDPRPRNHRYLVEQGPSANIGIVTGRASGIAVVDVDAKSGGLETWAELQTSTVVTQVR